MPRGRPKGEKRVRLHAMVLERVDKQIRKAVSKRMNTIGKVIDDRFPIKDGEPCSHPGCLHHIKHPCDGCGRIGGKVIDARFKK